ncbi:ubiquitin elongating factor core [Diaporthe amygdali]|uniref:ubiquitin elongating factor core n=1 Tax=Phomopsis amygdali TaxID=1214568 RepID=UPI0022FDDD13|nr:ubiquitin elongating factor core [Diaporthe amygdali]KAJ0124691.1 ubiquitin elongating factor core [Diaporthe amygdali]
MDPNEQPTSSMPDAPDKEKMEQIRRRRLEKLGSSNAPPASPENGGQVSQSAASAKSPAASSSGEPKDSAPDVKRTKINITAASSNQPQAAANPFTQLGVGSAQGSSPASGTNLKTKRPSPGSEVNRPSAPSIPPAKRHAPESLEDWSDKIISQIFRVTLDESRQTDLHGRKLTLLPGLSAELQEQDPSGLLRLSTDNIEQAILEAASAYPQDKPLMDYMLACWKRVVQAKKSLRSPTPEKEAVLQEAKRLCMSYAIFAVTLPDLFSRESNPKHDTLVPYLLRDIEHESGICLEFIQEAVARFPEDDSIVDLFVRAMVDISTQLSTMSMNDDYRPHVNSAPGIERHTLLGPFFRISPLQSEVTKAYFAGPRTLDRGAIKNSQSALQVTLNAHQFDLKDIVNAFVRASLGSRHKLLDWFAYIMNTNHKRRAIQVNPKEVASDGFMMNVTVILDHLCEPFMDTTFSKVDRIDVGYFKRNPRIDIKEETKLNADQSQSDEFYSEKLDGESNFISEIFFLTLAAHHYGSEAANTKLKTLDKDIKYYEKNLKLMEAERVKFVNSPTQLNLFDANLRRHTEVLERSMSLKFAIEGVLLDEKMQGRSLHFMRYVAVWLLRVASQSDYKPDGPLKLPLPKEQPEAFKCLPEYALQDVVDNFKFVFRYLPGIILSAVGDEMIALCIAFLESSEYVRNPYLKSTLVTLLYSGTWPMYHSKKGVLGDTLTSSKFANDFLLHAVMKFYIEAESTGAHTQFYDKFNIRYEIFQIIKCIWSNDFYRDQLARQSRTDRQFFVRFVNLLLNDATYVMDEALSKFPKIHELQKELRENQTLSQEDRQKKEEELHTVEGQATSYMQLANETIAMMKLFTNALSESFTMPEIVARLAGMLDYNLDTLVSPKSQNLKVDNPDKYHFNAKTLLPDLVDIFLNLANAQSFVEAVAADGRSYKAATFDRASDIMTKKALKAPEELAAWTDLTSRIAKAKEEFDQAELDFGDIPSEFEDPLIGDLMKDPVILPSQNVVDRSTIIQHLLSDEKDPFTRQPMTIDDVVPADDLRQQIEAWKAERLAAAKAKTTEAMDTSEG